MVTTRDADPLDAFSGAAQAGFPGAWDDDDDEDWARGIEYADLPPQRRVATGG
jgi:hypothetical protein